MKFGFAGITNALAAPSKQWVASQEALAQPSWGISEPEIPLLPISARAQNLILLLLKRRPCLKSFAYPQLVTGGNKFD